MAGGKMNYRVQAELNTKRFKAGANELRREFAALKSGFLGFTASLGASVGLFGIVSKMKDVAVNLSVARATLKNTSKTAEEFSSNLSFVDRLSKTYKQEVVSLTDSFAKFHAAAEGTNFSLQQQKDMFEGLTKAAAFYHMSAERTEDMLVAVEQMMSKGKITAEELRRQLGNNLPGAYAKMAKAAIDTGYAGVKSFADFEKAMKAGKIGVDLLDTFIKNLQKDVDNIDLNSLQLKANDLSNVFTKFVESSEFEKVLGEIYDRLKAFLEWLSNNFTTVFKTIETLFITVFSVKAIKAVATLWKALKGVYAGFMAGLKKVLTAIGTIGSNTATLAKLVNGLAKLVNGLRFVRVFGVWAAAIGLVATGILKIRTEVKNFKKDVEDATDALKQMASADWDTKDAQQRYEKAKEWAESSDAWLKEHHDSHQANLSRKEYLEGPNYVAPAFSTNAGQMRMAEIKRLDREIKLYNDKQEEYAQAMLKMKEAERDLKKIAAGEGTTPTGNTVSETSDFEKTVEKYREAQKELDNQLKAGAITLAKYNAETNDLVEKSWQSITAFDNFRAELAKLSPEMQEAGVRLEKAFGELGLTKSIESVTDAAQDYFKELVKQNALKQSNLTTDEEYDKALLKASETAVEAMSAIKNLEAVLSYLDPITRQVIGSIFEQYNRLHQAEITKKQGEFAADINDLRQAPNLPARWAYRDTTSQFFTKMANSYESKLEKYKELVKDVMEDMTLLGSMTLEELDAIGEDLKNKAQNFRDLADLAEWADELQKLKTEWRTSLTDSIVSTTDTMMGLVNSSVQLRDTLDDVKKTDWEKFMAVWDHLIGVFQTIRNLQEMIMSLQKAQEAFSAAKEAKELRALTSQYFLNEELLAQKKQEIALDAAAAGQSAANTSASLAEQSALAGKAIAGATASGAKMAFPYNLIAIAAGVSAVLSGLAFIKKFASGGIVGGNSRSGDRVLAGLNSGEMVINPTQQGNLWRLLNGQGSVSNGGGGKVEFVISGSNLRGVLRNEEKIRTGRS